MTKRHWLIISLFAIFLLAMDLLLIRKRVSSATVPQNMPIYSESELAKYSGENGDKPILLALDGLVYDVSPGAADFYAPGESYHYLVGKDSSVLLHVFGDKLIRDKYKVVGVYKP